MGIADDCLKEIRNWFRQKEENGQVRHFYAPARHRNMRHNSRTRRPTGTNPQIIFKEDTHLELGHPSAGSCSASLATNDASLAEDTRISLVGPEISETKEKILPFAQIAVACCADNIEDTCSKMDRILHIAAQTDGYMLRSVPHMIWARVSKEAARAGFSLEQLGTRLIDAVSNECEGISKSQVFFVTSSRNDVAELNRIIEPTRARLKKLQTFGRKEDGTYECDTSLDCNECPEKPVCDTIRDVITIRKGDRIIKIGGDDDGR